MKQGKVIIISAPSGSGKTTLVHHLREVFPALSFSISACTRPRRGRNEVHGVDYYFMSPDEFRQRIANDEFIEWEEVYPDSFYGTLKAEVQRIWNNDQHVIADVDVKGGLNLKKYFKECALSIFIKAPSLEAIKDRLTKRGTEQPHDLQIRLNKAESEMAFESQFEVVLVNDNLEVAKKEITKIVGDFLNS
jgi:guanylate kinase